MKRAFVTGGTGFIGRHLIAELVRRQIPVNCLIRNPQPPSHLQHPLIRCVHGDLEDLPALRRATADVDRVFHLAGLTHAITRQQLERTNGIACGTLADICLQQSPPPRMVYLSSQAAAGPTARGNPPQSEQEPCRPISDYGRSKRLGEVELQKRADRLPCTVIRSGIVCGPHDTAAAPMYRYINRYRLHLAVGMQTPSLSLIGVDDLVDLILRAAEQGETLDGHADGEYSPRGYYFACDDRTHPTYAELGRRVAGALDRRVFVWPVWRWVGRCVAGVTQTANSLRGKSSIVNLDKVREGIAPSWACSSSKAREQLGFVPALDLDGWLRKTADWYRANDWL